jgi:Fanconi-associated nuclease 1
MVRYPTYTIATSIPTFPTRGLLLHYYHAYKREQLIEGRWEKGNYEAPLAFEDVIVRDFNDAIEEERRTESDRHSPPYEKVEALDDNDDILLVSPCITATPDADTMRNRANRQAFRRQFQAGWIHTRSLSLLVECLERHHRYDQAVAYLRLLLEQPFFLQDRRGRWFDQLALHYHQHQKLPLKAYQTCRDGALDPHVRTGHKLSLLRRALRLCQSPKFPELHQYRGRLPNPDLDQGEVIEMHGQALSDREVGRKMTFLYDKQPCSVEDFVLCHVQAQGWRGCHSEGRVLTTLFTLLLWDVIFQPVPDVFVTPYQVAPLDLTTDAFHPQRQEHLRLRLSQLLYVSLDAEIRAAWHHHHMVSAVGVSWTLLSLDDLVQVAQCLGAAVLVKVFDLLAQDFRHRTGGFPDLLLWREGVTQGEAKFVEVKSPNDRLSDKQRIWLHVLRECGAQVAVCHVKATAGKQLAKVQPDGVDED